MKFLLHNEENIQFPAIRPAYQEGELLFERFRMLTPRDAKDSILGEGGTGIIHLVRDELLDRVVALKLPHENILRDPSARFDVIRETRQAIELTHPHIVRIHDFHEGGGRWGISMQHVKGMNLDEWRHAGRGGTRRNIVTYDVDAIGNWMSQLCDALAYAHEVAHMVHRDIKPKNLMLERWEDGHERLLLTDFGITQKLRMHTMLLSRAQPGTDTKGTMGTLPYMSWQQIQGAPASIFDDVYAVGATIYELLTGRPPFYEGSYAQIRTQVETVIPPTMSQRLQDFDIPMHDIPEAWEETVAACLTKNPGDRPQSIRELKGLLGLAAEAAAGSGDKDLREEIVIISRALDERGQVLASLEAEVGTLRRKLSETETDVSPDEWKKAYDDLNTNFEATRFLLDAAITERDTFHQSLTAAEQAQAEHQQKHAELEQEIARLHEISAAAEGSVQMVRQAEQAAREHAGAIESEALARIQAAESSVQQKIDAVQAEATQRIEQAEGSVQQKIDAIEADATERVRQAEESAEQRIAAAKLETDDVILKTDESARNRIEAAQGEAEAKIRQITEATDERIAVAKEEADEMVSRKMRELEEKERQLKLKTARPLAEALARLEAANHQVERLRSAPAPTPVPDLPPAVNPS